MTTPDPHTGAIPLTDDDAATLLRQLLDSGRTSAPDSLFVFDLDSTLLDNRPRQALIMREYGERHGVAALASAKAEVWKGWSAKVAMTNAGLDEAQIAEHFDPFRSYWHDCFFTSEYCKHDWPIVGAPEYVRAALDTGARVAYVTGRHEGMRTGTVESFHEPAFPVPDGDRIQLLMKPNLEESDDVYKDRTYAVLRELGALVAAFDNEPTHINGYKDAFNDATCVHLATDHSLREVKVAEGVVSIRNFAPFIA
jgi:hypothetical protein